MLSRPFKIHKSSDAFLPDQKTTNQKTKINVYLLNKCLVFMPNGVQNTEHDRTAFSNHHLAAGAFNASNFYTLIWSRSQLLGLRVPKRPGCPSLRGQSAAVPTKHRGF